MTSEGPTPDALVTRIFEASLGMLRFYRLTP
jgi:hypothetical protein